VLAHVVEVGCVWAMTCLQSQDITSAFQALYFIPALCHILGLSVLLAAQLWQLRLESQVAPSSFKLGIQIEVPPSPEPGSAPEPASPPEWSKSGGAGGKEKA
jgi:hypothetical protein